MCMSSGGLLIPIHCDVEPSGYGVGYIVEFNQLMLLDLLQAISNLHCMIMMMIMAVCPLVVKIYLDVPCCRSQICVRTVS